MVAVRERLERRIAGSLRAQAVMRECRTYFEEYAQLAPKMAPDVSLGVAAAQDAGYLADYIAANIALPPEEKQDILSTAPVEKRMELLLSLLARECSILELEQDIHERVHEQLDQNQKEYYLREQLKVISEELGDGDNPAEESEEYRKKFWRYNSRRKPATSCSRSVPSWRKCPMGLTKPRCPATIWIPVCPCRGIR